MTRESGEALEHEKKSLHDEILRALSDRCGVLREKHGMTVNAESADWERAMSVIRGGQAPSNDEVWKIRQHLGEELGRKAQRLRELIEGIPE